MGMYTEIYVNADLKPDTPQEVLDVLQAICDKDIDAKALQDKPSRWFLLFNNSSYYTPYTEVGLLVNLSSQQDIQYWVKGILKTTKMRSSSFLSLSNRGARVNLLVTTGTKKTETPR